MKFLDQAKIFIRSGNGGHGVTSFRREKFVPFGGPDGGHGGRGGHVYVECVTGLNTLIDYRYQQHFRAGTGDHGMGRNKDGSGGEDVILKVPQGTQILDQENELVLADMTEVGQRIRILEGGRGGLGNAHFKSSINQAPRRSTKGVEGSEAWLWLRLKLIADAGLVGLPNAGKSTFLSAVSEARPKVADYPFTTLHPQLGVVNADGMEFVIADLPGLIEGAHEGHGLGARFLGHVERCSVLFHLVDGTAEDIAEDYRTIERELQEYEIDLTGKPRIVALNKIDALTDETIEAQLNALKAVCTEPVLTMSAVSGQGADIALRTLNRVILAARETPAPETLIAGSWTP